MSEIPLAEVIRELRSELMDAVKAGEGESLRFEVQDLEVEMQVVVTKGASAGASGEVKFWVLTKAGAEASAKYESSQIQKIKLKLRPKTDDGDTLFLAG
jgi:hypothetical protein